VLCKNLAILFLVTLHREISLIVVMQSIIKSMKPVSSQGPQIILLKSIYLSLLIFCSSHTVNIHYLSK